jgi:hypothetical protein
MITLTREEAQQVLDALVSCSGVPHWPSLMPVIKTLRARLSAPEPEPVAWRHTFNGEEQINKLTPLYYGHHWKSEPLYTAPPQRVYCSCGDGIVANDGALCGICVSLKKMREWQGLTDEEVAQVWLEALNFKEYYRAIEAKLKEKNT